MEQNTPNIVVGGGVAGILTARWLLSGGHPTLGLERASRLGDTFFDVRLHDQNALNTICTLSPELEWKTVMQNPRERKKGNWAPLSGQHTKQEAQYLTNEFFTPQTTPSEWLEKLAEPVRNHFRFQTEIESIHPEEKKIVCANGSEIAYENLFWCRGLHELNRLWKGDKSPLIKMIKKLERGPATIHWSLEIDDSLFPALNSVVLPLRHKDNKLVTIGVEDGKLHWSMNIDHEEAEDREEVAKYIRTLKREIFKEFPELKNRIKNEKIVFSNEEMGFDSVEQSSLMIVSRLFYVGSEVRLSEEEAALAPMDRMIRNSAHLQSTFSQ